MITEHAPTSAASLVTKTPAAYSLQGRFNAVARAFPDNRAVSFHGRSWSYRRLHARAEVLAARLRHAGVRPGVLVALHLERGFDMVAGVLGALMTGAAYLPLDTGSPPRQLAQVLTEARPQLLLSSGLAPSGSSWRGELAEVRCEDVAESDREAWKGVEGTAEDLAYVIYTSGSTGRPKGCEIEHGAVLNLLDGARRSLGFTCRDGLLAIANLAFDVSVVDLFLPLTTGGQVVLADRETACDFARLASLIDAAGATMMQATPTTWGGLVKAGWSGKAGFKVLCGAEPLAAGLAAELLSRGDEVWNMYGPTEAAIWCAQHRVRRSEDPVPIGRPIDHAILHVVASDGTPAAAGEIGELFIGGAGLARGYRGLEAQTQVSFVVLPAVSPGRLYRSGDHGRLRPDGLFECLGRIGDQVKIRGVRIELGDVEATLSAHPGLVSAAARAVSDPEGRSVLAAYVVVCEGVAPPTPSELRRWMRERKPASCVPRYVTFVASLPLSAGGKLDRQRLPPPNWGSSNPAIQDGDAVSVQARLARLWAQILGLDSVAPEDNFFDLGGYSLLTVKLFDEVEREFGVRLTMAAIFAAPSLRDMAANIRSGDTGKVADRLIALQPHGARDPLYWLDAGPLLRPLAASLGRDQPLLGLNMSPEHEGRFGGAALDLAEVADYMADQLIAARPVGPYLIGGWCRWGAVALETARRLSDRGEAAPLVVLLDAAVAPAPWRVALRKGLRKAAGRPAAIEPAPPGDGPFAQRVEAASLAYRPRDYPGDVLLLRPMIRPRGSRTAGWAATVKGRLTVLEVPGDHLTMLQAPYVTALGAALVKALEREPASRRRPSAPELRRRFRSARVALSPAALPGEGDEAVV